MDGGLIIDDVVVFHDVNVIVVGDIQINLLQLYKPAVRKLDTY